MDLQKYVGSFVALRRTNSLLFLLAIALLFINLLLGSVVLYVLQYKKVILVPPVVRNQMSLREGEVPEATLVEYAQFVTLLGENFSYYNVADNYAKLLSFFDASYLPVVREQVVETVATVQEKKYSSFFVIEEVKLGKEGEVTVSGRQWRFISDVLVFQGKRTVEIKFRYVPGGGLYIVKYVAKTQSLQQSVIEE